MGLRKFLPGFAIVLALMVSTPAFAHEDHDKPAAQAQVAVSAGAVPGSDIMAMPGMAQDMDHAGMAADAAPKTFPQRLVRWLGAMHPAAVHFPIALFLVAAVLEIAALTLRRPVLTQGTRIIIALAAISALAAVALGWLAMGMPGNDDVTHTYHRWLGTGIAVLGLLSWWAKEYWVRKPGRRRELVYIGMLTVTASAILVNALLGGMLTHGVKHLMF
ncbi:DUF2231 domain-containing protein [uncultured Brevundimonas sp.]|uniref:DUF2231 domain-containing protein n=1 Tax=uncultured Brevundimonas sp. TaxID=213418 RepID=UPI0030EBB04C|tara:strand:- start:23 stop:673 length:651 start_codon:yes stop_codon:yes gene_type:complete